MEPMEQQGDDDHDNLASCETPRDGDTMENTGRRKSVVTFAPSYDSDEMPLPLVDNETNNDPVQWKSDSRELTYSDVDLDDDVEAGQVPNDVLRQSLESPVRRKGNRRESMVRDLSTGKFGGGRAQSAQLRSHSSRMARPAGERDVHKLLRYLGLRKADSRRQPANVGTDKKDDEHISKHGRYMVSSMHMDHGNLAPDLAELQNYSDRQYRLRAVPPKQGSAKWLRWLGLDPANLTIYEQNDDSARGASCTMCGVHPNEMVIRFLHWMFRKSLAIVMLTAVCSWFALSVMFAVFIWIAGMAHPGCIGGSESFGHFSDAFLLSWTTFSTVGYGCIYVGAGTPNAGGDYVWKCAPVNTIVIVEAFFGVLFASLISAVMFVKVARVQSVAQVEFCEPICVRFGCGVAVETASDDALKGADDDSQSADDLECHPCPILEFRIANKMNNVKGGEIIDATIKVVAVVSDKQDFLSRMGKSSVLSRGSELVRRSEKDVNAEMSDPLGESDDDDEPELKLAYIDSDEVQATLENDAFDEDPTGHLVPKTAFTKIECQTHQHPFFKRVFLIRHRLDQTSPLLKAPIREMVKANNGNWPSELNNARDVRKFIQFDQLLVSLRGTSNADAKAVHARKVYDFADMIVGYRFVTMLYRDLSGALQIDMKLINDVVEQAGGGGEDFSAVHSERMISTQYLL